MPPWRGSRLHATFDDHIENPFKRRYLVIEVVKHADEVKEQDVAIPVVVVAMLHDVAFEALPCVHDLDRAVVGIVGSPLLAGRRLNLCHVLGLETVVEAVPAGPTGNLPERGCHLVRGNVVFARHGATRARKALAHAEILRGRIRRIQKSAERVVC